MYILTGVEERPCLVCGCSWDLHMVARVVPHVVPHVVELGRLGELYVCMKLGPAIAC